MFILFDFHLFEEEMIHFQYYELYERWFFLNIYANLSFFSIQCLCWQLRSIFFLFYITWNSSWKHINSYIILMRVSRYNWVSFVVHCIGYCHPQSNVSQASGIFCRRSWFFFSFFWASMPQEYNIFHVLAYAYVQVHAASMSTIAAYTNSN